MSLDTCKVPKAHKYIRPSTMLLDVAGAHDTSEAIYTKYVSTFWMAGFVGDLSCTTLLQVHIRRTLSHRLIVELLSVNPKGCGHT